ncbi:MAG: beta-propeller fold lactonase family protein [Ramlibacter sp.]
MARFTGAVAAAVFVLLLGGCGGGKGSDTPEAEAPVQKEGAAGYPRFLFIQTGTPGEIARYALDAATGEARHYGSVRVQSWNAVEVDDAGRFLFVSEIREPHSVAAWLIGRDGMLTFGGRANVAPFLDHIAQHPSGETIYCVTARGRVVTSVAVDRETGALTVVGTAPAPLLPRQTVVHPSGRFAYMTDPEGRKIWIYTVNEDTGALSLSGTESTGRAASTITLSPSGGRAYVSNYSWQYAGSKEVIDVFSVDAQTGSLTLVNYVMPDVPVGTLRFTSSGTLAYASGFGQGRLTPWRFDAEGVPLIDPSLATAWNAPLMALDALVLDPRGTWAYANNPNYPGTLDTLRLDPATGRGTVVASIYGGREGRKVAMVRGTAPLTVTPRFAYIANQSENTVGAYAINPQSGALTLLGKVPAGRMPSTVAVEPRGQVVLVVNEQSNDIYSYRVQADGSLRQAGQPVATLPAGPYTAVMDVDGRFLMVANQNGQIAKYAVDSNTGAVSLMYTPNYNMPWKAGGMAVDPSGRFLYATGQDTNIIGTYLIGNDVIGSTVDGFPRVITARGTGTFEVTVDPKEGRFAWVLNKGGTQQFDLKQGGTLETYSLDGTTGLLAWPSRNEVKTPRAPQRLAVDPRGRFAYLLHSATGQSAVVSYSIDRTTGQMTRLAEASAGGVNGTDIVVDPSGRFVYVTSGTSGHVTVFRIESSGTVIMESAPLHVGYVSPRAIAIRATTQ